MRDVGIGEEVIAECVGVGLDVFPSFMQAAETKLAAAEAADRSDQFHGSES